MNNPPTLTPDPWYPAAASYNELNDVVTLCWRSGKRSDFYIRGAVAWPRNVGGRLEGFALVGGWEISTGRVFILDETPFVTVSHVLGASREITAHGAGPWFSRAFAAFVCSKWFVCDLEDVHDRYARECRNCAMLQPRPRFVHVHLGELDRASEIVLQQTAGAGLRFRVPRDGEAAGGPGFDVGQAVARFASQITALDLQREPTMFALITLLQGFSAYPWRNPLA